MSDFEKHNTKVKGIWIPIEIWDNPELNIYEKNLYAKIDSLYKNDSEGCFASNAYLAVFLGCSERTVASYIKKLIEKGYIFVSHFDGRKRYLKVKLPDLHTCHANIARQPRKYCKADTKNLRSINKGISKDNNKGLNSVKNEEAEILEKTESKKRTEEAEKKIIRAHSDLLLLLSKIYRKTEFEIESKINYELFLNYADKYTKKNKQEFIDKMKKSNLNPNFMRGTVEGVLNSLPSSEFVKKELELA